MDGTVTDGRKGIPYLRDHFDPAVLARLERAYRDADHFAPDRAERDAVAPAPV